MSYKKFKFISPGTFITEIDNSQLPREVTAIGPALIGRTERGPSLKPIRVESFADYIDIFGNPIPGGKGGDVFRDGNYTAPTYAAYAAQAWLRNNSPVTMVRLLGQTNQDSDGTGGDAGWTTTKTAVSTTYGDNGGAYGLFICEGPAASLMPVGTLPWPTGTALTSGTVYATASVSSSYGSAAGKYVILTGSSDNYLFTATGSWTTAGGAWAANTFLTGTSDEEIASNLATIINNSASADFSANSVEGYTYITASAPGTGGNIYSVTSSNGSVFNVTASDSAPAGLSGTFAGGVDRTVGPPLSGTLAAIWYLNSGAIALSGQTVMTSSGTPEYTSSFGGFIRATDTGPEFKVLIKSDSTTTVIDSAFNFTPTSPRFIRKVFNTNPTLTNTAITTEAAQTNYWLGETFEGNLGTFRDGTTGISGTVAAETYGVILKLGVPNNNIDGGNFRMGTAKSPTGQFAKTGWFISQDLSTNTSSYSPVDMQKLFRFNARELGEETQRSIKVSIQDIKVSNDPNDEYGTFTVVLRNIKDLDSSPNIIEQYNNCNLNPASENYIAKKIGNRYEKWDDTNRQYRIYGDYLNISNYVYVEMNEDVHRAATNPLYLPFGVYGLPRYLGFQVSGSSAATYTDISDVPTGASASFIVEGGGDPITNASTTFSGESTDSNVAAMKAKFPKLRLRVTSNEGFLTDPTDAYFGVDTTFNGTKFNPSVNDTLRTKAEDINGTDADSNYTEVSWIFSLDDVRNTNVSSSSYTGTYATQATYASGSRTSGLSYTAHTGSTDSALTKQGPSSVSYENVLDYGFDRFTTCLHGGADGLDITERDPFRNTLLDGKSETDCYAYNAVKVAIDSLRDPERVEFNLLSMPGLTDNTLNSTLINMCEQRGDALAVIDLKNGYKPDTESAASDATRAGSISQTISNVKNTLQPNSSYGCAYYPWVQIRDNINGATLWAPPSVVALGAMSYSEANSQLWFAPAGFTRGGLSVNQAAGIPVTNVRQRLTSKDRDNLYDAGINPIATFPAEGIVIFGQKTLQLTPSALDRINVRRLVLFLKKQISRYSATILFDQNVETTWNRFKSKVEPFLNDVKAGLGITDYRLILDETTTTPDLIDRNIMYAKIFIKPARAIEYIAIDFVISDSGASFED